MILEFHPDIPGREYDRPYKFLGYWHSISTDGTKTGLDFDRYSEKFDHLPVPDEWVDVTWNAVEREKVVNYLKVIGTEHQAWRGNSWCRFDGCETKHLAGYRDMTDGVYVWPEAFHHYVEVHGVKPPQEFVDHVLARMR